MENCASEIPLHLVFEDDAGEWRDRQPEATQRWLRAQDWNAERHRALCIPDESGELIAVAVGLGKPKGEISMFQAAAVLERLPPRHFRLAQSFSPREAQAIALGFEYAAYRFERYRRASGKLASLASPPNVESARVKMLAEALKLARDCINTPAADFGPADLAQESRRLADRHGAVFREIVGDALIHENFGAIHAVGRASAIAPRLIELRSAARTNPQWPLVVLIGKGVCFDSGGLDLKPSAGMLLMKKDMGGAAMVLALAHLIWSANLPIRLRVLIPAVENAVGPLAFHPGDVLKSRKGLTIEVGNTDAEGRLVLCDALAAADEEPCDLIVDFATLTGAARVALGPEIPALFSNDHELAQALQRTALRELDPLWHMPLWSAYEDELSSKIADLNNVAASSFAGAIFGALFLRRFVTRAPRWLHIDCYAWNSKERPGRPVGAEPQGVRALFAFLNERYPGLP